MDLQRFDELTKSLSTARSRRGLLRTLGGALGAAGLAARGGAVLAQRGNSACAHFCAATFGADTPAADQCTRDAAHGGGLCYQCGPAASADNGLKVCGQTCIPQSSCCTDSDCDTGRVCTGNGVCVIPCDANTPCPCGFCLPNLSGGPANFCEAQEVGCAPDCAECGAGQVCFSLPGNDCPAICGLPC